MDYVPALGGTAGLIAFAGLLIWRLVRLSVEQETRLLQPAYHRIEALERRTEALENENELCQRRLGKTLFALASHGIEVPE